VLRLRLAAGIVERKEGGKPGPRLIDRHDRVPNRGDADGTNLPAVNSRDDVPYSGPDLTPHLIRIQLRPPRLGMMQPVLSPRGRNGVPLLCADAGLHRGRPDIQTKKIHRPPRLPSSLR